MQPMEPSKPEDESSKIDIMLKLLMEQKTEIEKLKQQQQLQLNHNQINTNVSSYNLKPDNDFSEFDTIILDAKAGLMSASTTNAWRKKMNWYKEKFGKCIKEEKTDIVLTTLFKYVLDPKNVDKASSKRCILVSFYAILCALGRDNEISLQLDKNRMEIHKILKKQEDKERAQGLCKGWIAFSDLDFRHMFNRVVQQFGDLPLDKLQLLLLLLLGKVTGRRSGEMIWIAASSWKIKFHTVNGRPKPQLSFDYCFQKNKGPGIYTASFIEVDDDSGEVPPVALTLLLLEKKKIIPNAFDAYTNGSEKLNIDHTLFESTAELYQLLCDEHNKFRQKNMKIITASVSDQDTAVEQNNKFYDTVLKQVKHIATEKIPMWTSLINGRQSSTRFDPSCSSMIQFGKFCFYTPTPSLRFGGTCARKGFKQDATNSASLESEA